MTKHTFHYDFHQLGYMDLLLLENFYKELYQTSFSYDERDSLQTYIDSLKKKEGKKLNKNNFHLVVSIRQGSNEIIAGAVANYLFNVNTGILWFLTVRPDFRSKGIGTNLLEYMQKLLNIDAKKNAKGKLDAIIGEINDPEKINPEEDTMNPFQRISFFSRRGFYKIDFPYVQPPISDDKKPVDYLIMIIKPGLEKWKKERKIRSSFMIKFLYEFVLCGFPFKPESNREFLSMKEYLHKRKSIPLASLSTK